MAGEGLSEEDYLTKEDKTVGWHHLTTEHESEQALGASEGQGSHRVLQPTGQNEPDMTE